MHKNRYLDEFTENILESDFSIEAVMKTEILDKTYKKIKKNKWAYLKSIAAACILLVVLSAFIPDSPVNALCKRIFSFIPGVGIVQNSDGVSQIKAVLNEPVKVLNGDEFVEIKTAYITDNTLRLSIKTNVGAVDAEGIEDPVEFKRFFAGETAPTLYLVGVNGKTKSSHSVWSSPSFETRVYSIDVIFNLDEESIINEVYKFEMAGFNKLIEITMSSVNSGTDPESVSNVAVIDNIMVFANISRGNGILEVLLSSVAPEEYNDIRFHLFDHEAQLFNNGIKVIDEDGMIYMPDEKLRENNNGNIGSLYFNIPDKVKGLKLVVPQILYNKRNYENGIKISMPKIEHEKKINKKLDLPGSNIIIETASVVPVGDPLLPDGFKEFDCLRIDAGAVVGDNKREMVLRVIPRVEVPDGSFGYNSTSQSSYAELWGSDQKGYSITSFDGLTSTKKILINFDVEYAMTGPWIINLK
jgi:hypothetical protein